MNSEENSNECIIDIIKKDNFKIFEDFMNKNGFELLSKQDSGGVGILHTAISVGNKEIIRYLIDKGIECSGDQNGQLPIHFACIKGNIDIVRIILQYGFDIDARDLKGYTPLMTATQNGHVPLVIYLIGKGAKIDYEDLNGDNALHWAAYKGQTEIVSLLIYFGLNPKRMDNYGQTALHLACLGGHINVIKQLITQVDLNLKDNNNNTCLDLALGMKKNESKKRFKNINEFIEQQKSKDHYDEIITLIKRHRSKYLSSFCDWKSLWFGPALLNKEVFIMAHFFLLFIQYPLYIYYGIPFTYEQYKFFNYFYIFCNIFVWITLYGAHLSIPGFVNFNSTRYGEAINKMIFLSQYGSLIELKKCLAKVCHTCKLVRPYRSSHCRTCNRCVLAFDHHCPYIGNCVGYNNRLWFYSFTFLTSIMSISNLRFCYIILHDNPWFYALWLATLLSCFYSFMAVSLFVSTNAAAFVNLTSNEYAKKTKYEYLSDQSGKFHNIFDRGFIYNLKYYFYLIQPSKLETEAFEFNFESFV